jgi:DNA-binding response OmpR family regulator
MTDPAAEHILVVEDDPEVRRFIEFILSRNGFRVTLAGNATDGLSALRNCPNDIALVVLDMVMPGMSGLDLAAELEREKPGMPILYVSGYIESVAMTSIARMWPDQVLFKPFSAGSLLEKVRYACRRP